MLGSQVSIGSLFLYVIFIHWVEAAAFILNLALFSLFCFPTQGKKISTSAIFNGQIIFHRVNVGTVALVNIVGHLGPFQGGSRDRSRHEEHMRAGGWGASRRAGGSVCLKVCLTCGHQPPAQLCAQRETPSLLSVLLSGRRLYLHS